MYQSVELLVPIFAMLTTFGSIFGMFYVFITTRHKERMTLIENGFEVSSFSKNKSFNSKRWLLRLALLSIGVATGILIATIILEGFLYNSDRRHIVSDALIPVCIFLFAGLGLLTSYIIEDKAEKKQIND